MKSPMLKEIYRSMPLIAGFLGVTASTFGIFWNTSFVEISGYVAGILGSMLGAVIVYLSVRIVRAASAPTIFVSYSIDQAKLAKEIVDQLEQLSVRVLYDREELRVGDSIDLKLKELIDQADFLVFIISERGMQSLWVRKELEFAISKHKRLLPVLAERVEVPEELRNIVFADFTGSFDKGFADLRLAIEGQRRIKVGIR